MYRHLCNIEEEGYNSNLLIYVGLLKDFSCNPPRYLHQSIECCDLTYLMLALQACIYMLALLGVHINKDIVQIIQRFNSFEHWKLQQCHLLAQVFRGYLQKLVHLFSGGCVVSLTSNAALPTEICGLFDVGLGDAMAGSGVCCFINFTI